MRQLRCIRFALCSACRCGRQRHRQAGHWQARGYGRDVMDMTDHARHERWRHDDIRKRGTIKKRGSALPREGTRPESGAGQSEIGQSEIGQSGSDRGTTPDRAATVRAADRCRPDTDQMLARCQVRYLPRYLSGAGQILNCHVRIPAAAHVAAHVVCGQSVVRGQSVVLGQSGPGFFFAHRGYICNHVTKAQ